MTIELFANYDWSSSVIKMCVATYCIEIIQVIKVCVRMNDSAILKSQKATNVCDFGCIR